MTTEVRPGILGIFGQELDQRIPERAVAGSSEGAFQVHDPGDQGLHETDGRRGQQMEDVKDGRDQLHLVVLFGEGEGGPLQHRRVCNVVQMS